MRCPTCRAPGAPQAADVFTSVCRAHGVPAPQPAPDQDTITHQYHQALAPCPPSHVLPFCCPRLFLADSANAASDGAWQELPDRHMHFTPVHSRQTGCWSPEWVCMRCNSTVDEHHPLLQGVPAAPVCPTRGPRRLALDLRVICANTAADGCAAADPLRKFSPAPASVSHSLKHQLPRETLPRACQLAQPPRRPTQLGAAKAPPTRSKGAAHAVGCLYPYCTPQSVGSNPRRLVLGIVMFTMHRCGRAPLTSMPCIPCRN